MKELPLAGALLGAWLSWSSAASAQAPKASASAPAPTSTAPAASAELAEKPPAVAAKPAVDSTDTRGVAMRAYQAALDKQKLSASQPLSLARLRDGGRDQLALVLH